MMRREHIARAHGEVGIVADRIPSAGCRPDRRPDDRYADHRHRPHTRTGRHHGRRAGASATIPRRVRVRPSRADVSLRSSPRPLPFLLEWDSAGRGALGPQAYVRYHPCLVNEGMGDAQPTRAHRIIGSPIAIAAIVASPLVLAAILLATRPWAPVLDMAMTELRVRDVGTRHTPLIGLPGTDRDLPRAGQPPRAALVLPTGPVLPPDRGQGVGARARQRGDQHRRRRPVRVDRSPPRWAAGHRRLRRDRRRRRARLRAERADPPVEPVLPGAAVARRARCRVVGAGRRPLDGGRGRRHRVGRGPDARLVSPQHDRDERARVGGVGMAAAPARRTTDGAETVSRDARHRGRALDPAVRRPAVPRPGQHHACWSGTSPAIRRNRRSASARASASVLRHLDAPSAFVDLVLRSNAFVHRSGLEHGTPILGALVLALWIAAAIAAHRMRHAPARRAQHRDLGRARYGFRVDGPDLRQGLVLPHALGVGHDADDGAVDGVDSVVIAAQARSGRG